jgi:hypothetical protein
MLSTVWTLPVSVLVIFHILLSSSYMSHLKKYTFILKYFRLACYFIHIGEVQIFFWVGWRCIHKEGAKSDILVICVCLSTWNNTVSTGWNLLIHFDFDQNSDKITDSLHEYHAHLRYFIMTDRYNSDGMCSLWGISWGQRNTWWCRYNSWVWSIVIL